MTAPRILKSSETVLNDSAGVAFDASPLPAAGAARKSEIVSIEPAVQGRRTIVLRTRYAGGASAAAGQPHVRIWVSCKDTPPADSTDVTWALVGTTDGSITANTAFAGGTANNNEVAINGGDLMRVGAPVAAAVVAEPLWLKLELEFGLWLYIEAAEIGETAHPGTLTLAMVDA